MDLLIDDNDRLKPCPFCGGATFDHDDNGWNWIECLACGASTNARVSAMDDCKPLLLEQWNKRVPPACGCREGECESKPAGFSGAQSAPEKLCYDSRWKISIDYVDGWNAAIDAVRGKSPSWYCPDCCIVFPFGEPKSCPHDDARCNRALKAAPEAEGK